MGPKTFCKASIKYNRLLIFSIIRYATISTLLMDMAGDLGIMKIMKVTTITKPNVKKAQRHLAKLRELVSKRKHPFSNMTEEEIINTLRKTREEIWGKKLAARS